MFYVCVLFLSDRMEMIIGWGFISYIVINYLKLTWHYWLEYILHSLIFRYMEQHTDDDLGMSPRTFFRCRPSHVQSFTKAKMRACQCEVCENPRLKIKALNRSGVLSRKILGMTDLLS